MTSESIVADLESRFEVAGQFDTYAIPSGEPFIEFVSSGVFRGDVGQKYGGPTEALWALKDTLEDYIGGREHGTLYWRHKPEVKGLNGEYIAYARLLIK